MAVALEHPAMELVAEEWAPIAHLFNQLVEAGHVFDPTLAALVRLLERQVVGGEDDSDADQADEMLSEGDDGDEDASDDDSIGGRFQ